RGGVLLVGEQLGDLLVNACGMIHRRTPGRGGEWNGGKGESFGDVPGSSAQTATATTHQRRAGSPARRHAGGGGWHDRPTLAPRPADCHPADARFLQIGRPATWPEQPSRGVGGGVGWVEACRRWPS